MAFPHIDSDSIEEPSLGSYECEWINGSHDPSLTLGPEDHVIAVTVTDGNGCMGEITQVIYARGAPSLSISGDTLLCEGPLFYR